MQSIAQVRPRLAVLYDGAAGPKVYRVAVEIAAKAWDSGSSVRVRRVGPLTVPEDLASRADWFELLSDADDIPEVASEDLDWATVTLVVSRPLSQRVQRSAADIYVGGAASRGRV
jgi:transglutaminase-like putative cysteine protease